LPEYIRIEVINEGNSAPFLINNNFFHGTIVTRYNSMSNKLQVRAGGAWVDLH
jgi:hypothetical protein